MGTLFIWQGGKKGDVTEPHCRQCCAVVTNIGNQWDAEDLEQQQALLWNDGNWNKMNGNRFGSGNKKQVFSTLDNYPDLSVTPH